MTANTRLEVFQTPELANQPETRNRLEGYWLFLAKVVWIVVASLAFISFVVSLPAGYRRLNDICLGTNCAPDQLTPAGVRMLEALGLSVAFYAGYHLAIVILIAVVCCGVALVIFWQRPDDQMAWFVSLTLIIFGIFMSEYSEVLRSVHWVGGTLLDIMSALGWIFFGLVFYLFPDGRFVPAWTQSLSWVWVASQLPYVVLKGLPDSPLISYAVVGHWPAMLQVALFLVLYGSCSLAQLYRYRHVSSPVQRQQTKWIVFGLLGAVVVIFGTMLPEILFPAFSQAGSLTDLLVSGLQASSLLLVSFTIGIAILRYRLWDIDLIINRTLVYGSLTLLLGLIYWGSIVMSQQVLRIFAGQQSDLSLVASTLAIAGLFNPLRRRLQLFIDRRFYRQKYDMARTLATFSASLRDEVDLTKLLERLETIIWETVQPAYVLSWLNTPTGICLYQFATDKLLGRRVAAPMPEAVLSTQDPLVDLVRQASGVIEIKRLELDSPHLQRFRSGGVELIIPLISQGELIGWLSLGPRLSGQGYSADDRSLLANLASQAAPAVRIAELVRQRQAEALERERLEHELGVARLIQQTLLPKEMPELPGWQMAVHWQPARAVGGDFYDFLLLPDGRLALVIADVAGKGVPGALVMATTRAILRGAARRLLSPSQALARANDLLCPETPPQMFVTCLYALLDPGSGRLQYANAGHELPYRRKHGQVLELKASGMPLGLVPDTSYEEQETIIGPGECLLFYSDGLIEAHNEQREMFGLSRLRTLLADHVSDSSTLLHNLLDELSRFTGEDWEQEDDVTLLTLQRSHEPSDDPY